MKHAYLAWLIRLGFGPAPALLVEIRIRHASTCENRAIATYIGRSTQRRRVGR